MADLSAVDAAVVAYGEAVTAEVAAQFADLNNQIASLQQLLATLVQQHTDDNLTITQQAARITKLEEQIASQ